MYVLELDQLMKTSHVYIYVGVSLIVILLIKIVLCLALQYYIKHL